MLYFELFDAELALHVLYPHFDLCVVFYKQIIPAKCRYEVLTTKIEIRLAKAEAIHWRSLEFSQEPIIPQKAVVPSGMLRFLYYFLSLHPL